MVRINLLILLSTILPGTALSFEKYIKFDIGSTQSSSSSKDFSLTELTTNTSESNHSDTSFSFLYGNELPDNFALEAGYSDMGDTIIFPLTDNKLVQQAEAYILQLRYRLATFDQLTLSTHLGFSRWHTKIYQQRPRSSLLVCDMNFTLLTNSLNCNTSLKQHGYTFNTGLAAAYQISQSISLGIEYQYYMKTGNNAVLVDKDKLAVGDIVGALRVVPAEVSLNILSVNLSFRF